MGFGLRVSGFQIEDVGGLKFRVLRVEGSLGGLGLRAENLRFGFWLRFQDLPRAYGCGGSGFGLLRS